VGEAGGTLTGAIIAGSFEFAIVDFGSFEFAIIVLGTSHHERGDGSTSFVGHITSWTDGV